MSAQSPGHLKPIQKKTITEAVLERLSAMIREGSWQPGDKLPSERELAETLHVSRSSIREALKTLEFLGYVQVQSGGGTFVTANPSDFVNKSMRRAIGVDRRNFLDLIAARQLIEPYLAGLAAERIQADDLTQLRALLDAMTRSAYRSDEYMRSDYDFHLTIAEASGNQVLFQIYKTIRELQDAFIEQALALPGTQEAAFHDHTRILNAITQHDPHEAREVMESHLETIRQRLLTLMPLG